MNKKGHTLYSACLSSYCKCEFPQSSGILNAVLVTRDAALPALLEPGARCGGTLVEVMACLQQGAGWCSEQRERL